MTSVCAPPLEGIEVLDLTQYLAGPTCSRMLMELGAQVTKVELAPYGDPSRSFSPRANQRAGFFVQQNRGKRSVCVDFSSTEGARVIADLAAVADVVVENFTPGVLARRGLSYEHLVRRNPDLIMASISGFGQTGALSHLPAFDFIAQAYAGVMHMNGEPDGPPLFVGIGLADVNVGVHAFAAVGHALFRRERTGSGAHLDLSMVDCLVHMHETSIYAPHMTGGVYDAVRQGRYYQPSQPGGVYQGPEGWIVVFCTQGQVQSLFEAMGHPDLLADERFATNEARLANRAALTELIETWMAGQPSDAAVVAALGAHRVPCSRVQRPVDLLCDEHLLARDAVRIVHDVRVGDLGTPGFPIRFLDGPAAVGSDPDLPVPRLGQHNREALERAGYAPGRVTELETARVLQEKDR